MHGRQISKTLNSNLLRSLILQIKCILKIQSLPFFIGVYGAGHHELWILVYIWRTIFRTWGLAFYQLTTLLFLLAFREGKWNRIQENPEYFKTAYIMSKAFECQYAIGAIFNLNFLFLLFHLYFLESKQFCFPILPNYLDSSNTDTKKFTF